MCRQDKVEVGKKLAWVLGQLSRAQGEALALAERKGKKSQDDWTWADEWALERALEDVAALEVEHDDLANLLWEEV